MSWMPRPPGPPPKIQRATIRRVIATFSPYRWQLAGIAAAVLVAGGLGLLPPLYMKVITDQGITGIGEACPFPPITGETQSTEIPCCGYAACASRTKPAPKSLTDDNRTAAS